MKFFNIKHTGLLILQTLMISGLLVITSCSDEELVNKGGTSSNYDPSKDPTMVCLPLKLNLGEGISSQDVSDASENTPGYTPGDPSEHKIDFDKQNECYAIIFDAKGKIRYLQPLFTVDIVGDGEEKDEPNSEFSVYAVTYVKKKDVVADAQNSNNKRPLLDKILVVLNGGRVYEDLLDKAKKLNPDLNKDLDADDVEIQGETDPNKTYDHIQHILDYVWAPYTKYHIENNGDIEYIDDSDRRIGFNDYGHFTMTNATYYMAETTTEGNRYEIVTAQPIEVKNFYTSVSAFLKKPEEERKPSARVAVERMVAKFSAPTFSTDVIGSDLVFRPDQKAMPVVVYSWDGNNDLYSEQKNWRIHLTGWTINGLESASYLFKHIPDNPWDWQYGWSGWNIPGLRSYWSVDPHYNNNNSENPDFYPWQFRKAADLQETISIQTALTGNEDNQPALRYKSFREIHDNDWVTEYYTNENTFDPITYRPNIEADLDGRASYLAGPHLIITGELYLQDPNGKDYESMGVKFAKVDHIYSDRIRRYYRTEADWFKMFVKEFNHALRTQERMRFPVYDWDEHSDGKAGTTYKAVPTGECKLFYRLTQSKHNYWFEKDEKYRNIVSASKRFVEEITDGGGNKTNYVCLEMTYALVDFLAENVGSLSTIANVRNGDGRLIPWIEGLCVRTETGAVLRYKEFIEHDPDDENLESYSTDWNEDMYKSLVFDWFGPIDHYNKGYMYYAGDILHNGTTATKFYGAVRNHWYKFKVAAINSLGIPVDNPDQLIIPGRYNYRDQIIVYLDIIDWHPKNTEVGL